MSLYDNEREREDMKRERESIKRRREREREARWDQLARLKRKKDSPIRILVLLLKF